MKGIISMMMFTALLAACSLHSSDNGMLDGYWSLRQVDTLSTGASADYSEERVFWSFQAGLMQTSDMRTGMIFIYRFGNAGDTVAVTEPYLSDRTQGDVKVTEEVMFSDINRHGINSLRDSFFVERLTGSRMVLRDKMLRLHFEKY
ncbi:MAG: lipocalin-like domain-containing protein [Bacteroidales bacterium]|nr:lipocalin-like domain-containing protein [Bacteroidales bacterium]MCM1146512.1 lipocalin-like domain-containing protein [Bacteroidales bacterium]MCM1207230.1 lipocalin-like domain-containing protein [Bacillota bacterium]MCM1509296.1 lipocalin-like domain-containing protein [Clostridium sp.]